MASFSTLLLLAVLPALLATSLGAICEVRPCYQKFTLIGTDDQICDSANEAIKCAETALYNNSDCAVIQKDIRAVVARTKKITQCYGCRGTGNYVPMWLDPKIYGVCDYRPCYQKFTLSGTDHQFCHAAKEAIKCAETTLYNNPNCAVIQKDIRAVVARAKKITQCYGCRGTGNSVSVSFLTVCCGLVLATYFPRSK